MSRANIHEVAETTATFTRQLENGQSLVYQLQVLQQPERARACGMGAKSHADRRPVDPPPVVELRLFQGVGDHKAEVTFAHNANFFLFATLEHARPVAQARGMPAPAPTPVLTGVPVSGMAYLDRPIPAGYFIFPDLSVRHEGKYRLRFALYEQTNEDAYSSVPRDPLEPREFCTHRVDVKSKAFTVFSAKKFPGLAESTTLSRIVAEQGCRVRIRRDVRMRRRNDRTRGRESEELDETALLRAQRAGSPDQYDIEAHIKSQAPQPATPHYHPAPPPYSIHHGMDNRKRSNSDISTASLPDVAPHQPSRYSNGGGYMPGQSHGQYGGHPTSQAPPASNQHLAFGGNTRAVQPPAPPSAYTPQDMYSRGGYTRDHYQAPPPPPPPPPSYHSSRETAPSPHTNGHQRRNSVDEYRQRRGSDAAYHSGAHYRPSTPSLIQQQQQYSSSQMQNGFNRQQPQYAPQSHPQQYSQPQPQQQNLPPIRGLPLPPIEPRWNGQLSTPTAPAPPQTHYSPSTSSIPPSSQHRNAPPPPPPQPQAPTPTPSQLYYDKYAPSPNSYASTPAPPQPAQPESKKRAWGRVFNTSHTEGAMHNKMRPDTESDVYGSDAIQYSQATEAEDDGYGDLETMKMTYRRADGVEMVRKLGGDI